MGERWSGQRSSDEIAANVRDIKTNGAFFSMVSEMGKRVLGKVMKLTEESPYVKPSDDPTSEYRQLMQWLEVNQNDEGTWSQRLPGIVERQGGIRHAQYNSALMEMNRYLSKEEAA